MTCPCCSNKLYTECCEPFHLSLELPKSAEQLMRSRYAAYAIPNGAYLMDTTYPNKRYQHSAVDMEDWGKQNQWLRLEIIDTPVPTKVEFKAFYKDKNGQEQLHHEVSTFKQMNDKWYYYSSKFIHI